MFSETKQRGNRFTVAATALALGLAAAACSNGEDQAPPTTSAAAPTVTKTAPLPVLQRLRCTAREVPTWVSFPGNMNAGAVADALHVSRDAVVQGKYGPANTCDQEVDSQTVEKGAIMATIEGLGKASLQDNCLVVGLMQEGGPSATPTDANGDFRLKTRSVLVACPAQIVT